MVHSNTKPAPAMEFVISNAVPMGLYPVEQFRERGAYARA
jgi:hypothetical protein